MHWKTSNDRLYRSIMIYGIVGVLLTSLMIALISIVPLYLRLQGSVEDRIAVAANTKAESIASILAGFKDVADQIASRSAVRDQLSAYAQGKISRDVLFDSNQPKLADALQQSRLAVGIQQYDARGNLIVQVGSPIPAEASARFELQTSGEIDPSLQPVIIKGELYLVAAREILDSEKKRVGVDQILFQTDTMQKIAVNLNGLGESTVTVIGMMRPAGFEPLLSSRPLTDQEKEVQRQAIGQLNPLSAGSLLIGSSFIRVAVVEADTIGWVTLVQIQEGDLYGELRTQVVRVGVLTLFLTILGSGGMVFLLRPLAQGMLVHEKELEQLVAEKADQYQAEYEERLAIEQDLRQLSSRYQSLVQTARDAIILADQEGKIVDWNSAAETILGYSSAEMVGESLLRLIPERIRQSHQHAFTSFVKDQAALQRRSRGQWSAQRKDGSEFPADITLSLFEMDGKNYIAMILRDITEMRNIETALQQSQERYRSMIEDVVDASSVAICITDPQIQVVWENRAAIEMWDINRDMVIGSDKRELLNNHIAARIDNGEVFVQNVLKSYTTNRHLENVEIHFPANQERNDRWVMYSSKPIRVGYYAGGRIEQYVDITEQKHLLAKIELLAMTDGLTGIYNRRGLSEHGKRDLARAHRLSSPLCAIFLDIDHFKDLNDRYGHTLGDQILRELAQRIQRQTRDMDLFARYGGEEYVILLPDTPLEQAGQIAERIRCVVADFPFFSGKEPLMVTISVGIACLDVSDDLVSLLKKVDQAMYRAKQNGRNRVEIYFGSNEE